jgi:hypothetical protein
MPALTEEIARMTLRTVRLELARCYEFPEGSRAHGYEFTAPLDAAGHFDAQEWKGSRDKCSVRRFWGLAPDELGTLIHVGAKRWAFSYVPGDDADDEPIFKFDRHVIQQGEYVSITEHDGVQRTFRVAAVR